MSAKKTTKKTTKKVSRKTAKKRSVKTTRRSTAKKAATKKKKYNKVRALVCAQGEKCFWTTDGTVLENLEQLEMAFGSMDEEVFLHHVTKEKNDFADWVEIVLQDAACAADLRRSRKPSSARTVVRRHLRLYKL